MNNFRDYYVTIGTEPSEYGSNCTQYRADGIADYLAEIIAEEFGGIHVLIRENGSPVSGPDAAVCEEIRAWIQEIGFPVALLA